MECLSEAPAPARAAEHRQRVISLPRHAAVLRRPRQAWKKSFCEKRILFRVFAAQDMNDPSFSQIMIFQHLNLFVSFWLFSLPVCDKNLDSISETVEWVISWVWTLEEIIEIDIGGSEGDQRMFKIVYDTKEDQRSETLDWRQKMVWLRHRS